MKKFGLIGYPISHSLSPAAFKAAYNGKYTYDLIETPDWEKGLGKFIDEYAAVQVTMPFKELAFASADFKSPECVRIGAANILVKTTDGIVAHNSDYLGVKSLLTDAVSNSVAGSAKKALVVGCGGAGKAAAVAALDCGFEVYITNRTISKAEEFAQKIRKIVDPDVDSGASDTAVRCSGISVLPFDEVFDGDLLIYCLPCAVERIGRWKTGTVLEANYKDPVLHGLAGTLYISGLAWHRAQAITGFRIMTGMDAGNLRSFTSSEFSMIQ